MYDDYRDHLWHPRYLNEGSWDDEKEEDGQKISTWEKYSPVRLLGKASGAISRHYNKGFSQGWNPKGKNKIKRGWYGAEHGYKNESGSLFDEGTDCENSSVCLGVGTGKAFDNGNFPSKIKMNNYDSSDRNFVKNGEDPETSNINIPAILAARTAGGYPDPKVINNGINNTKSAVGLKGFKLQRLRDDCGQNG